MVSTNEMRVRLTWRPQVQATLAAWIDDDEFVWPMSKSVFRGRGRIEFDYPTSDDDGYHKFEWTVLFPDEELRQLKVEVSWDGSTWHTVGAHKKSIKHTWASFGVAP